MRRACDLSYGQLMATGLGVGEGGSVPVRYARHELNTILACARETSGLLKTVL